MISVIIPTVRRPQLLRRAVSSALAQSLPDIEVVVVVDGPDPETTRVLSAITDARLRVIQNTQSLGAAAARNIGVESARGGWIAFLDDDDEWLAHKLERQMSIVGPVEQSVIISCLSRVVTPFRHYVWPNRIYDNDCALGDYLFDRRTWFRGDVMLQCSSLLMPRSLSLALRFTPQHDDWDLLLRAVRDESATILTVAEPLVIHHTEEERESLGTAFDWKDSLIWADRSQLSPHAFAGFCLTVISPQAAKAGSPSAFFILLFRAFKQGSPRPIQVALYLAIWLLPDRWRRRLRSILQRPNRSVAH